MPSRRTSIKAQEAMWEVPRGGHHYVRIHDSARKRDILFLVPTQHLVQQGMLFSARVHFERPDPEPGFIEACAKVGIPDGWARRALSAGRRLPEDVFEWVQLQKDHPPASGCKMTIIEEVPPGEFASTTLSSGEHVRVELPAGAIAGQELLFVLPPTTPEGCAPLVPASAARSRLTGARARARDPPQARGGSGGRLLRQEEGPSVSNALSPALGRHPIGLHGPSDGAGRRCTSQRAA
jgi:hypothetical protein